MEKQKLNSGQVINTHDRDACMGETCCIHNPSDHPMSDFDQHWRDDAGFMERICPHGVGHPDPDDLLFRVRRARERGLPDPGGVHGCDGCCHGSYGAVREFLASRADDDNIRDEEET